MNDTVPHRNAPERLKSGVLRFQSEIHAPAAADYDYVATHPQKPHTLFITCSDSRIAPEAMTSAGPGQIFVTRNIGNLVPSYSQPLSDIAAVIEYAVTALKVSHVVICGHSDCGAMKACLHPSSTDKLPAVRQWLEHAEKASASESKDALRQLTERNVLKQLENLKTHPAIVDAMADNRLTLAGWVYEIGSGEVRIAPQGSSDFRPVQAEGVASA